MLDWLQSGDVAVQFQVTRDVLGHPAAALQAPIAHEGAGAVSYTHLDVYKRQHHILLMDLEGRSPEVRLALTQNMMFKRVDGLIVINVAFRSSEAEVIKRLNLPVVAVGNAFNGAPLVGIDDVGCAALGTQHLIDLGHTALGYVGKARPHNPHGKTPPDRLQGFVDALHEADVRLRHDWILECDWSAADAYAGALKLLASPDRPTAILAGSDEMALGLMAGSRCVSYTHQDVDKRQGASRVGLPDRPWPRRRQSAAARARPRS